MAGLIIAVLAAILVAGSLIFRSKGYKFGGNVVARCRKGHYFTTLWVPGASLKSVRLGWARFQWCPVGRHWSLVVPVRDQDLSDEQRAQAAQYRDLRLP